MSRFDDMDSGYIVTGGARPKMRVRASTGALTITVAGSAQHPRDPRIALSEGRGRWEGFTPPVGKLFCSHPYHDDREDGGWVDRNEFAKDTTRASGRHPYCNACRARHRRRMYALMREAEGKQVRQWKRR